MLRSMSDHYRSSPSTTKTTSAVSSESGGSPLRMRPTHDADSWDRRFSMEVRILLLPARPTYRRLLYKSLPWPRLCGALRAMFRGLKLKRTGGNGLP